jgi:hypothetical protein
VNAARIARRIGSGPAPPNPGPLQRARTRLREGLFRVLKPYTVFQRDVNEDLLHAIQALDDALQGLATGQAQLRPQVHRLVAEAEAAPAIEGLELREHPVAGVVQGFSAASGPVGAGQEAGGGSQYAELIEARRPVVEVRSVEELARLDDRSVGAVVARRVLERLSYDELVRFFELCALKLGPEGALVAESGNPHSGRALKALLADPRVARPVFPEVALRLAAAAGFDSGFVFHPDGTGNVEADRFYEADYVLVAERGGTAGRAAGSAPEEAREPAPASAGPGD